MTGDQLATLLEARGVSGTELAAGLGVDRSTVTRWLNGRNRIGTIPEAAILGVLSRRAAREWWAAESRRIDSHASAISLLVDIGDGFTADRSRAPVNGRSAPVPRRSGRR